MASVSADEDIRRDMKRSRESEFTTSFYVGLFN